jgi:hypothetical protein
MQINWKIGVEIELLAPPASSRAVLAQTLAQQHQGRVRRVLHQDSEPSKVPGQPLFYNLTQGFEALDANDQLIVRCVDDLTLQDDLDRQKPALAGWWRMVSDDERLLRLLALHTNPELDLPDALNALAPLFNGQLLSAAGGMFRLVDQVGAPLAIAAPLPGERERPCELITPPLESAHAERIEQLLCTARNLGFVVPREGATHIHFDAAPLCQAQTIANLVNVLSTYGARLRLLCGTPAHFRRVGGWPDTLLSCVNGADFHLLPWPEAVARLRALNLSKYCDFNLKNIAYARADRHTFEVRIFPAYTQTTPVIAAAALMQGVLHLCQHNQPIVPALPQPWQTEVMLRWLETLQLDDCAHAFWCERAGAVAN